MVRERLLVVSLAWLALCEPGVAQSGSYVSGWGLQTFDSRGNQETSFVQIGAGVYHTVARRMDGSIVAWGDDSYGQTSVPTLPSGLTYVEVAAGYYHTVARRSASTISCNLGLDARLARRFAMLVPIRFCRSSVATKPGGPRLATRPAC